MSGTLAKVPLCGSHIRGTDCHERNSEIFGPVLAIVPVKDVDEAIAFVNAR